MGRKMIGFILLYTVNIIKIICTFLIPFTNGNTLYFSIYSLPILLLLGSDQIEFVLRITLIITVLIIWLLIIIFSILSIKRKENRDLLSIFSIIASLFDCILPMIFSTIQVKILAFIICFVIFMINVGFLSKKTPNN